MLGRSRRRHGRSGFTLIELMLVVAIVGIMATLAIMGYRRYLSRARTGQTKDLMGGIIAGQHAYFTDTRGFLNCSSSTSDWYPATPDDRKRSFHNNTHLAYLCWRMLAADASGATYASFSVVAGTTLDIPPPALTTKVFSWPTPTSPWFILHAATDTDADSEFGYWVAWEFPHATFGTDVDVDIYAENITE